MLMGLLCEPWTGLELTATLVPSLFSLPLLNASMIVSVGAGSNLLFLFGGVVLEVMVDVPGFL